MMLLLRKIEFGNEVKEMTPVLLGPAFYSPNCKSPHQPPLVSGLLSKQPQLPLLLTRTLAPSIIKDPLFVFWSRKKKDEIVKRKRGKKRNTQL